ncbi:MAG: transcription elongation factor GreA [Caldilineaceae bacterium]
MAKNEPVYLTADGLAKLQEELAYLTGTRRREVAKMIAEAKAEGDISENAGYDEAKTTQGFLEGRIREIESIVNNAQIIEQNGNGSNGIGIGHTVVVQEDGSDMQETYTIVGSAEASPAEGRISNESPIGQALLGKKVGDSVSVASPGGTIVFEILSIS